MSCDCAKFWFHPTLWRDSYQHLFICVLGHTPDKTYGCSKCGISMKGAISRYRECSKGERDE